MEVSYVSESVGLSESDVRAILDLVRRLKEEEKRLLEELKEQRKYYYLGYLPITYRVRVNV
jgi:hypothetical protein